MSSKKNYLIPSIVILAGVVGLSAVLGFFAFQDKPEYLQGQAEVTEYRVSSKVPGRIAKIYVKEGQLVKAGDTLALLEAPDIDAKLAQARAAEAASEAQSRKAEKGARQEQIAAAYEMWKKAQAGAEIARQTFARVKRLHEQGVMTAQKLDEATANLKASEATEKAARAQYDLARNGAEREDKEAAAALVSRAQGAVEEVNAYRKETVLTAAADGEVTDIFPSIGELVGTGAPVMNIARMDDPWVTFHLREDLLPQLQRGSRVEATVPALQGRKVVLHIDTWRDMGSYAVWKATKMTGEFDRKTFEVKATFTQPVEGLRPGMSVLVER